jgi:large subunit ribosomal protein L21e
MVKPSKGPFSGRTRKLKGRTRVTVAQAVRTFNLGDKVVVSPKARCGGLPNLRYCGRHGVVRERRGNAYMIEVGDMGKKKQIVVGPVHLKLAV